MSVQRKYMIKLYICTVLSKTYLQQTNNIVLSLSLVFFLIFILRILKQTGMKNKVSISKSTYKIRLMINLFAFYFLSSTNKLLQQLVFTKKKQYKIFYRFFSQVGNKTIKISQLKFFIIMRYCFLNVIMHILQDIQKSKYVSSTSVQVFYKKTYS